MTKRTRIDQDGKTCTKCGEYKTFEMFYRLATTRDGRSSWCKCCAIAGTTAAARRKREAKPEARSSLAPVEAIAPPSPAPPATNSSPGRSQRSVRSSAARVHYSYKVSKAEAARLRAIRWCECCGNPVSPEDRTSHIDHDYSTGIVRGVLCPRCNTGIGKLGDTLDGLERAAYYLMKNVDVLNIAEQIGRC